MRFAGEKCRPDLKPVFTELRSIRAHHADQLDRKADGQLELSLDTRFIQKNKQPLFFGAVQVKKHFASFRPVPVCVQPALLGGWSPALQRRMHPSSTPTAVSA